MHSTTTTRRPRGRDETVGGAIVRVLEAGQKVLVDRIDLTRLEVTETVAKAVTRGAILVIAGSLGLVGWLALMGALAVWLSTEVPVPAALLVVAGLNGVVAIGLALSQRASREPARAIAEQTAPPERVVGVGLRAARTPALKGATP